MIELMFDRYRTDDLMQAYRQLGGLVRAAEAQRLAILAVLIEREAHRADGCLTPAQWVAAADLVTTKTGQAMVDTAVALEELPAVAAVAATGALSMEQLVPVAALAEPATDAEWAERAPGMTPAALEQLVRQKQRVRREDTERQHVRRSFRWWRDRHGFGMRFAGLLPDDAAAIVTDRIEALAADQPAGPDGLHDPFGTKCADALVEMASSAAAEVGRAELVVHVPVGIERQPQLPDGTILSIDTVRRLACDSTAYLLVENPDGTVAGYGRRRRLVPEKMRRRLKLRDKHCVWLGCDRTRGLKGHHIRHWTRDGPTDEDNCVLLCPSHHYLVHEGGWAIRGSPTDGTLEFVGPYGQRPQPRADAATPDLLGRFGLDAA